VTEKAVTKKDDEQSLCFEVHPKANKLQIKKAVETLFKVKVSDVRTSNYVGNCGGAAGSRPMLRTGRRLT